MFLENHNRIETTLPFEKHVQYFFIIKNKLSDNLRVTTNKILKTNTPINICPSHRHTSRMSLTQPYHTSATIQKNKPSTKATFEIGLACAHNTFDIETHA